MAWWKKSTVDSDYSTPSTALEPVKRRGLNVPPQVAYDHSEEKRGSLIVAPDGLPRVIALMRAQRMRSENRALAEDIIATDFMTQIVGRATIFNRDVLEIADSENEFYLGLMERGAIVTRMRPELSVNRRIGEAMRARVSPSDAQTFTAPRIPSEDEAFDTVVATNILAMSHKPSETLDELARVLRPGGTLYLQQVLWWSPSGGRETSPWHLLSGNFARKRYQRHHGHAPAHFFGENLFRLSLGSILRAAKKQPDFAIVSMHPRYGRATSRWVLRLPIVRELLTLNVTIILEKSPFAHGQEPMMPEPQRAPGPFGPR